MEYLGLVLFALLSVLFMLKHREIQRFCSSNLMPGFVIVTVLANIGSNVMSSEGIFWMVIAQATYVAYANVRLGFTGYKLWNASLCLLAACILLAGKFGHLSIRQSPLPIAVVLITRWCCLELASNNDQSSTSPDDRQNRRRFSVAHVARIGLSRWLEKALRWLDSNAMPALNRPLIKLIALIICLGVSLTTLSVLSNSILVVPPCSVAVARDLNGHFSARLYAPGLRAVRPYIEQLVVVPVCPFEVPNKNTIKMSATTSDRYRITARIKARMKLQSKSNIKVVQLLSGVYRGDQRAAAAKELEEIFVRFIATKKMTSFLPLIGEKLDTVANDILSFSLTVEDKGSFQFESINLIRIYPDL